MRGGAHIMDIPYTSLYDQGPHLATAFIDAYSDRRGVLSNDLYIVSVAGNTYSEDLGTL